VGLGFIGRVGGRDGPTTVLFRPSCLALESSIVLPSFAAKTSTSSLPGVAIAIFPGVRFLPELDLGDRWDDLHPSSPWR
jgi:hypothetical protein